MIIIAAKSRKTTWSELSSDEGSVIENRSRIVGDMCCMKRILRTLTVLDLKGQQRWRRRCLNFSPQTFLARLLS